MLKALIVEDELLARVGLHTLVDWKKLGYELLEDAKDGETALAVIRETRPYVIFLDINIPGITGIELMQRLLEEGIKSKIVVISSYEDYKTVRAALKLGAVDYISKLSLKKEDLSNLLQTLGAEAEWELPGDDISEMPDGKQGGRVLSAGSLAGLGGEFAEGWGMAIPFGAPGGNNSGGKVLAVLCEQYLNGNGIVSKVLISDNCLLILIASRQPDQKIAGAIQEQINQILHKPVWIGIGGLWRDPAGRERSLSCAKQIETLKFYAQEPVCRMLTGGLPEKKITDTPIAALFRRLESSLEEMEQVSVENIINRIFELIKAGNYLPVTVARRVLADALAIFSRRAQVLERSIDDLYVAGNNQHYQCIMNGENLETLRQWYIDFIRNYTEALFVHARGHNSLILTKTLEYIADNLHRPLQLSELARFVNVSDSHLSSLFKRKIGLNLISYIHQQRIKEAKRLLERGEMIYKISEKLGYDSSSYFSKVFKKQTGISPEQFQRQAGTNGKCRELSVNPDG
jgi:AraC-like DNA-binding protein/CheY-like chemotaxis protein